MNGEKICSHHSNLGHTLNLRRCPTNACACVSVELEMSNLNGQELLICGLPYSNLGLAVLAIFNLRLEVQEFVVLAVLWF